MAEIPDPLHACNCIYADKEQEKEYCLPKTFDIDEVAEYDQAGPDVFKQHKPGTLVFTKHGTVFFIDTPYKQFDSLYKERAKYRKMGL